MGEAQVTLVLPQHLDENYPLPLGQGHDGVVETVALVTARCLNEWIALLAPGVDQPDHVRLAEEYIPPGVGSEPDALASADGRQPAAEPVRIGELVDVLQAALPCDLGDILGVGGRQPALTREPPQQRLVTISHGAPSRPISRPDSVNKFSRGKRTRRFGSCIRFH